MIGVERCGWVDPNNDLYVAYHDDEWGVPLVGDDRLFELLTLESAQAGLSWITVLRKRDRYRAVFDGFDPALVAKYDDGRIATLLQDPGIIRNRLKVESTVSNARAVLEIQAKHGSFASYLWSFVDGRPIQNTWQSLDEVPAETDLSSVMSKQLKRDGFRFVGSTICYAFMQAAGLVNDHVVSCHRYDAVRELGEQLDVSKVK